MIITKRNLKVQSKYLVPLPSQVMAEVENFENKSSEALISISGDLDLEVADKHDFIIFKKYPYLLESLEGTTVSLTADDEIILRNYDQIIGIIMNLANDSLMTIIRLNSTDYDTINSLIDHYASTINLDVALDVPEIRINDLLTKVKKFPLTIISADKWDLQGNEYLPEIDRSKLGLLMLYIPVPVLCKELYLYPNLRAVHTVVVTLDKDGYLENACTNLRVFYHINFKIKEGKAKLIRLDEFAGCDLENIPVSYYLKIEALDYSSLTTDEFILEEPEFCEEENYIPIINAIIEAKASYVNCYAPFFACLLLKVPAELMEKLLENTTIYLSKDHILEKTNNN